MKKKRKISVRKILQVFLTLVATTFCIIAMVSASRIEDAKMLKSVAVHINNHKKYHFIEQNEIMDLAINNRHIDIAHTPLSRMDIHSMEQVIMSDPWVADAQVYIDNERVLQIYVTQRIPVARLFKQSGSSCYIDSTLSIMPLSDNYVYYTLVVTNVPELNNDSAGHAMKKDIVSLVRTIQRDTFWNAQISHVAVDSAGMFELFPVLGDQRILFGDASRMKDKFNNLFAFYKNVLNRIGWDKYETLDLRFKAQVIASPSLPYTGPIDKAVNAMNWINSIAETEGRKDSLSKSDTVKSVINTKVVKETKVLKPVPGVAPKKVTPAAKGKLKELKIQKIKKEKNKKGKNNKQETKKPKYVYPENKHH